MELTEDKTIRKILIKCPPALSDCFNIFPFLIAVSEEFPTAELFFVCEEGTALAYQFLPFKHRAFERPKTKVNLVETHHYCANLHDIFNIDLFFDLENSFNSAFMGLNFRARERVGYSAGWNKHLLTHKFPEPMETSLERKCVRLLELYLNKPLMDLRISRVRTEGQKVASVDQLFQEPEPPKFVMVMLDNLLNVTKQIEHWKMFFDCFNGQKFVIWSQHDEDQISELFAKIDLGENELYIHKGDNSKELTYLLNKVIGVVTNNLWAEGLCNYFGVQQASFVFESLSPLPAYQYFFFRPQRFVFQENGSVHFSYIEERRELEGMNHVVDHLHLNFKL
jgi:ADP-heptose:LPS heptosyltransferase